MTKTGTMSVVNFIDKDFNDTEEVWINDDLLCTLPVFLEVHYTSLKMMHGMALTGGTTSTERI